METGWGVCGGGGGMGGVCGPLDGWGVGTVLQFLSLNPKLVLETWFIGGCFEGWGRPRHMQEGCRVEAPCLLAPVPEIASYPQEIPGPSSDHSLLTESQGPIMVWEGGRRQKDTKAGRVVQGLWLLPLRVTGWGSPETKGKEIDAPSKPDPIPVLVKYEVMG